MEHASIPIMVQDRTMLGTEKKIETRQLLLQRASSMEKRDKMTAAIEPWGAVTLSWRGQSCGLNIFWSDTAVLQASVMPRELSASFPCAWDTESPSGSSKRFSSRGHVCIHELSWQRRGLPPRLSIPFFLNGERW